MNRSKQIMKVYVFDEYDQIMDYVLNQIQIDLFYLYIHFENHVHTSIYDMLIFENQSNHSINIYTNKNLRV
jgi:hypothetical protein